MKKFFTILITKFLRIIGKLVGKGSSLPGKIALKLCPDILSRVKLPPYIIAVTGSNGKTSTVEMIAHLLTENGKTVAWNKEGSNQIEGVTTLVLSKSTLGGRVKSDILLIESDERFARYTFRYITPTHYVITNLYRDQLTRNGHPEWVYDALADSISDKMQLILNADDPLVSLFGYERDNVLWFGADKLFLSEGIPAQYFADSGCRREQGGQHFDGGGLSRSVLPQQPEDLPLFYIEGNTVHRFDYILFPFPESAAGHIFPSEVPGFNHCFHLIHTLSYKYDDHLKR